MKKNMPKWLPTLVWGISLFLTAFFLGQTASLYLESRLIVPKKITLAKEKPKTEEQKQSYTSYQREISPVFEARVPSAKSSSKKDKGEGEGGTDWDEIISQPDNIYLQGTVVGDEYSIAFINVNGKDISIHLGQELGGYIVHSITGSTVVFQKGTEKKVVAMKLDEKQAATGAPKESIKNDSEGDNSYDLKGMISREGDKTIIDRVKFNALLKPPSRFANELKFIPNSKDGTPYGIRVSYLKPGSFFSKIGLRAGDVLIKTNNKELKSVEDSFYAYQAFRNEEHLTMEVDRKGKIVTIPLEFR